MSGYKNIAIAGATGHIGPIVTSALVTAGFSVTVLSRSATVTIPNIPSDKFKVAQIDYSSQDSLVRALKGQDVLISTVPAESVSQPALIDAAIAAGVDRFIPSEFGSDTYGNEHIRKIAIFSDKIKTQDHLKAKKDLISHTIIISGAWLDFCLKLGLVGNPKGGKTTIFDGGHAKRSMTLMADVGNAVVGVLKHPDETRNRAVYVNSTAVSQNRLMELAKKNKPDIKVDIVPVDTADLEKRSNATLMQGEGDIGEAVLGLIAVSIFREGYGGLFEKTDNELLGIKELSDEELLAVVGKCA